MSRKFYSCHPHRFVLFVLFNVEQNEARAQIKQYKTNNAYRFISFVPWLCSHVRAGILTGCPSAAAFAIALGPPHPWLIASATETLDFRGLNFTLGLWLLIPTFSLRTAPLALADRASVPYECSPTTVAQSATSI